MSNYRDLSSTFSLLALLLFTGACSSPQPANKWQHDAVSMCSSYQTHFLQDKSTRAVLDLRHARELASRSSDLKTLLDIELTSCAMELGVLNPSECPQAQKILQLQPEPAQHAYYALLTAQLKEEDIPLLPSQYRSFAKAFVKKDSTQINKALLVLKPLTSRLISSALAKESISADNIQALIDELSYHGYKRPLIVWLNLQMQREDDADKKAQLQEKIALLTSN